MKDSAADDLTIIGIGSSAGGLEAIRELVATLPANLPATYVVVQHMSPHHKSLMTELVTRQTDLKVADITDGLKPEQNVIYITPPKTDVVLKDGLLHLVPPSDLPSAPKPSVDRFLLSLADTHGSKSMAMILSGTGTDGSYGVQAIREAGGITIAQDSDSAKYDGMPQSAIQTGCVDLILRPHDIGTHLQKILTSPRDFAQFRKEAFHDSPVTDLLQILLARTRVDFREYKQTTIMRRIDRRMMALGISDEDEYALHLRNNPQAVDALFKDLLISVTRFFRDPEEFEKIVDLLPGLIENHPSSPLRIWIAGCATGEEAYSIAMLVAEALGGPEVPLKEKVQIFATDLDKAALQIARQGNYPSSALNDIPPELAKKYVVQHGDGIRMTDVLRSAILFSDHNVCQDPPFQKIDLLCCRNVLIYFGHSLQKKVMARFHYAMSREAIMFLGNAESNAGADELFSAVKSGPHVFRKRILTKGTGPYMMPNFPSYSNRITPQKAATPSDSTDRQLFEALVQSLGEDSILVTEDFTIMRVYGSISPYIEMTEATNLKMHLDLVRSPLREEARSLITIALKNKLQRAGVRHTLNEADSEDIQLDVYPIVAPKINERVALVVFRKLPRAAVAEKFVRGDEPMGDDVAERIAHLENEVAVTREALQQTIEELETSNEELQSLNEEMQSTNEELQATNEELETSNEELQSTNEELITVNEELQVTATELSGKTGELTSVLQSTPLAIVVTDSALQITQATFAAAELFEIRSPILSPHISQCRLPKGYPPLASICSEALRLGSTTRDEFTAEGTRVMISCTPYFDIHGKILGLTMVVTTLPGLASEMEMILNTDHIHLMNRTPEGEILRISAASAATMGLSRENAIGKNAFEHLPPEIVVSTKECQRAMLSGERAGHVEVIETKDVEGNTLWLNMEHHIYQDPTREEPSFYSIASDVTAVVDANDQSEALLERFRRLQDLAGYGYWELDTITQEVFWSPKVFELHGMSKDQDTPDYEAALKFYHPDDVEKVRAAVDSLKKPGDEFSFEARLCQADGNQIKVCSNGYAVQGDDGKALRAVGTFVEVEHAD